MRRLWTTAAAAALCVFAGSAWGAPYGGQLELVAVHHHHLRGSQDSESTPSRHRKGKSKARSESTSSKSHERRARKGRHHEEAASEEPAPHAKGRRGRHHAEEAVEELTRGRHGRHAHARAPSEIRTESGGTVEVGKHDTLESISRDTGVTIPELAKLNRLKKPYRIRKGAELKLPERRYYVVKSGDTISGLARKFGVESSELAGANDLSRSRALRAGQKFYLPGSAHEAAPPEEEEAPPPERPVRRPTPPEHRYTPPSIAPTIPAPAQRPYATPAPPASTPAPETDALNTPPAAALPGQSQTQTPAPAPAPEATQGPRPYQSVPANPGRPIIQSSPAPSSSDVATAGKGRFIWPVNGQVIQGFGPKADGQRNDGLNIQAGSGDPVRAAGDGEVVYAGDQVPSFGNLVLIKHAGGWVTAYAHMARIMVKNRDTVVQGQQIGVVGQTGQVDRPQLHFEIRYAPSPKDKATPVDPALVLPEK